MATFPKFDIPENMLNSGKMLIVNGDPFVITEIIFKLSPAGRMKPVSLTLKAMELQLPEDKPS